MTEKKKSLVALIALIIVFGGWFGKEYFQDLKAQKVIDELRYEAILSLDKADYKEAFKKYEALYRMGDMKSAAQLGELYEKGKGTETDIVLAHATYMRAAKAGDAYAQVALADFYSNNPNYTTFTYAAEDWYEKAAEQGHYLAALRLGELYLKKRDFESATEWFLKSANQGMWYAHLKLGEIYSLGGAGVIQDYIKAHMHLNLANRGGVDDALLLMDTLAIKMDKHDIVTAQNLAREWMAAKK